MMAAPNHTVLEGIIRCGVSNALTPGINTSPAMRIATQIFADDFASCMDMTDLQIDASMKTFTGLTQAQGQVRVMPGVTRHLKAFTEFACYHIRIGIDYHIRIGIDPSTVKYDPMNVTNWIRQRATQKKFEEDASNLATEAKPSLFKKETKWVDWSKTFWNYLRLVSSRNGIPICYVIRANEASDRETKPDFLDTYVNAAPLTDVPFNQDAATVYTILKNL